MRSRRNLASCKDSRAPVPRPGGGNLLNPKFPRETRRSEQGRTVQTSPIQDKRPQRRRWTEANLGSTGRARRLFAAGRNKGLISVGMEKTPSTKKGLQKRRAEGCFSGIHVKELFPFLLNSPKDEKAAHQNRDPVVIQGRRCVLDQLYPVGEEKEGKDSWKSKRWKSLWDAGQKKGSKRVGGRRCKTGRKGMVSWEG